MAKAKEMLDELTDNAPEADPFPTIRESLAELGANPDKYEKILAKTDDKFHWEKVFRPKTTLEAGAITLLAAAKQSGAEPEEYLSRLAPYYESRIQSLPDMYNVSGYVSGSAPTRAVLTRTAREMQGSASTLPHELEHTLQNVDSDKRGPDNIDKVSVPGRPDPVLRFGGFDSLKGDLQKRLSELPEEERNKITAEHPVFGRYLSRGNELFARIRAKDMLDSAKGGDFLQTEMGQKLFPTDRDRSYFIGSTLPGVPTITPPYTFESTDKNKKPLTDPKTSYARQLFNALTEPKEYQEGGEVSASPDLAQALEILESDPAKYKSMYLYLLTKGDIENLNDKNLEQKDIAALGLVHAATLSNKEPEEFVEQLRPNFSNVPARQADVRPNVMLQGSSGGFNTRMAGMNYDVPFVPEHLMGRVGAETDVGSGQVRAGVVGGGMRTPQTGVMPIPVMGDVGFNVPVGGGTFGLSASAPLNSPRASNTNVQATFTKRFQDGGEVTDEFPEEAGAMPGQNPSEAAKRLLYYKKTAAPTLPPGVVPDTGQLDGIYQDPNVASETARVFGMQPREDRLTILPRYSRETGLVAPEMLYDAARAVTAPSVAAQGYEVAPEEAVNMALNFTGAGLGTSTAMKKPMGEGGIDLAMNAYHGSPYDIPGKFDVSKAGTGTGAQQYGHGVYFAEARPTAERFKKGAKQKGFDFKAEEEALGIELPTNARSHFMILSQQMPDNPALDPLQAAELILSKNPEARNIPKEKLAALLQTYQEKTQGNLYQVDIPDAQVAKMLDWNKPLSQQSPEVLDILKKLPAIQEDLRAGKTLDDLKGGNAYQAIAASFNVRQNEAYKLASEFLNAQGIPGLRYDDYYAPGQSNFVVFDPSMVKMLMRNDKPVSTLPSSTTAREDLTKLLGYSEDIPNEKWLANKIEDAVDGGKNSFGVPRRMGSITGYFEKPVEIPVELLSKLPGERGEQSNVRKDSLDYIRKNWDKVSKEPPYIEVDPFGKAWVSEGNHRIMVAKELGLKTLPVEIRYFSGGQRKAGELAPEKILEYNKPK